VRSCFYKFTDIGRLDSTKKGFHAAIGGANGEPAAARGGSKAGISRGHGDPVRAIRDGKTRDLMVKSIIH
jgi:hypothetical protein